MNRLGLKYDRERKSYRDSSSDNPNSQEHEHILVGATCSALEPKPNFAGKETRIQDAKRTVNCDTASYLESRNDPRTAERPWGLVQEFLEERARLGLC